MVREATKIGIIALTSTVMASAVNKAKNKNKRKIITCSKSEFNLVAGYTMIVNIIDVKKIKGI